VSDSHEHVLEIWVGDVSVLVCLRPTDVNEAFCVTILSPWGKLTESKQRILFIRTDAYKHNCFNTDHRNCLRVYTCPPY